MKTTEIAALGISIISSIVIAGAVIAAPMHGHMMHNGKMMHGHMMHRGMKMHGHMMHKGKMMQGHMMQHGGMMHGSMNKPMKSTM